MPRNFPILFFLLIAGSFSAAAQDLKVLFTMDKNGGCGPLVVHFTSQTTASANAQYHWQFGNGNTAVIAGPEAVYTDPGSYTVTLTVQDGQQQGVATGIVNVYAPPTAAFTVSATRVCVPSPVTFTSTSSAAGGGAIGSWLWDFGDGTTQSGGPAIAHAYGAAATATVSLTVTDNNGCVATQVQPNLMTILPRLTAAFTTDKRVLCAATDPVQFTNGSMGPGTLSYQWSFGDGTESTQASPAYSYAQKGTYTVILTATSSAGCSAADTQANFLNVANYKADFNLPAPVCLGGIAVFTDQSTPAPGSQTWQIDGIPAGNGASLSYLFNTAGSHTITLADVFGACPQTVSKPFLVNPLPSPAAFDEAIQGKCGAPVAVNFTDHTPGAVAWAWVFRYNAYDPYPQIVTGGPGNSYTYGIDGTYTVQLTVTNAAGCSASITQPVTIASPVVAIYEPDGQPESSCGLSITKTYAIAHPELLQSYSWDFGDGATSTALLPTHTFTNPGQYLTVLHYTDLNGCMGVSNALYTIVAKPLNVDFSAEATTVCAGSAIAFGSPSLVNSDAIWTTWDFGDGTQSLTPTGAYHAYTQPGVYTVTLFVQNAACQQTVVKTNYITVLASPTVSVSHTNTCARTRGDVTFTPVPGGGATSLAWDFGDGTQLTTDASGGQLVHTYAKSGTYTVTVVATNGQCSASVRDVVYVLVKQNLVLSAGPPPVSVCPDGTLAVQLSADQNPLSVYGNPDYTMQFEYGDSTPYQGSAINTGNDYSDRLLNWNLSRFQSGESGLLVITTSTYFGCQDTSNILPLAIKGAVAGYEIIRDDRCYTQPVVLEDTSATQGGDAIVSWSWDFGDGQGSTQSGTVSHLYAAPGSYSVRLTVQDAGGCSASSQPAVAQVSVNGPLAAWYSPGGNTVPLGSTVVFSNSSNVYGSGSTVWSWDFGDGGSATDFSPAHVYAQPGTYTVVLTARDAAGGCASTATGTIVVKPFNSAFQLAASYVASGTCPPALVQFTNTSVNYSSLSWDFGDGVVVANVVNPSHVYAQAGTYIVTLTVVGVNGLVKQTIDSVIVAQPSAVLSAPVGDVCQGQAAALQARGNFKVTIYTWDYGDGSVGSGADSNTTHLYATAGRYEAKLIVTDGAGCPVAAAAGVAIDVHAPPELGLTPPAATICRNAAVGLSVVSAGGDTYSWWPAAGLSQTTIAAPVAAPTVNTVYTVTVADAIGCTNTGTIAVTVVQPESVSVNPDSVAICPGQGVELKASGADAYSWMGAGLSSLQVADPMAKPSSSTVYTVMGSDAYSCFSDTATVIVHVLPQPTVNAGADVEVLAETPVQLTAVGSDDIVSWQWAPAVYLSCTDCAQPVCTPKQTTQYIVTVTGAAGCQAADTIVVKLLCEESRVRIPDAFTPNGDGHNDRFNILGISEVNHLVIYDRWGQKVFERNHFFPADPDAGWDGTMGGRPAPAGVYAYFVEMQCQAGGVFMRRGTVVLVR